MTKFECYICLQKWKKKRGGYRKQQSILSGPKYLREVVKMGSKKKLFLPSNYKKWIKSHRKIYSVIGNLHAERYTSNDFLVFFDEVKHLETRYKHEFNMLVDSAMQFLCYFCLYLYKFKILSLIQEIKKNNVNKNTNYKKYYSYFIIKVKCAKWRGEREREGG